MARSPRASGAPSSDVDLTCTHDAAANATYFNPGFSSHGGEVVLRWSSRPHPDPRVERLFTLLRQAL